VPQHNESQVTTPHIKVKSHQHLADWLTLYKTILTSWNWYFEV